jgi:ubiquinone/menaquinone biosynthesis C-methylase UbiE
LEKNQPYEFLQHLEKQDGVYLAAGQTIDVNFEDKYLQVRKKENRLLTDEQVRSLPILNDHPHTHEWQKRARSAQRVSDYFLNVERNTLLDLGCGNGWFTALLAKNNKLDIIGMDINLSELKQAARIFEFRNLHFLYGDIFRVDIPGHTFNYITLNAAIQYFGDMDKLINRLFELLKTEGEIHIIDSPLYDKDGVSAAKQRTVDYFSDLGFPEMSNFYHHHTWSEIQKWDYEVLYSFKKIQKLFTFVREPDMPFPWIKIVKKHGQD